MTHFSPGFSDVIPTLASAIFREGVPQVRGIPARLHVGAICPRANQTATTSFIVKQWRRCHG